MKPGKRTYLSENEIDLITHAGLTDPFSLLGMHPLGEEHDNRIEVRTFCPSAKDVQINVENQNPASMIKVHNDGLFAWISEPDTQSFSYTLIVENENGTFWETRDPYSFLPQLGELDLHLLAEGNHYELYNRLGARLWTAEDIKGVLFSVWAPSASSVSVIGSFNNWDRRRHPMRSRGASGVWELFIPGITQGDMYKYSIRTKSNDIIEKSDPLALASEYRPRTASVVADISSFSWSDDAWMESRKTSDPLSSPLSIYELHAPSWKKPRDWRDFTSWNDLAENLIPWVKELGFTHIELLPIMEHPFDGSWGYQTVGYFTPTSRLGKPEDFQRFVNSCHAAGIGVILDWAPAHFPSDATGLGNFDGTCLYEHEDPKKGFHPDWKTLVFNYDRKEVKNFLVASGLFWLDKYHIDGLRVDAVASMLYLDYSRKEGEWIPNRYGGRENLGAIEFMKTLNSIIHKDFPGAMVIAEESTAWPGVTTSVSENGLGFTFKWNMGWMHDTLSFFQKEPVHRKHHIENLTFSLLYAFSENYILPISHDEVVHGKASLLSKCPGDRWQKFANLRLLLSYQWAHPGKQLLFMGSEFGQWNEWDHDTELDWNLLEFKEHTGLKSLVKDLNNIISKDPAFYELDCSNEGFRWIDFNDAENTVISFLRRSMNGREVICVFNMTPVIRDDYWMGVPSEGTYTEILNTDADIYGGSGKGNLGSVESRPYERHGFPHSINITLPPLAALFLTLET